jgi:hypothetical protein
MIGGDYDARDDRQIVIMLALCAAAVAAFTCAIGVAIADDATVAASRLFAVWR